MRQRPTPFEDDMRKALDKKRLLVAKMLKMPASSGISSNLPIQKLNTVTRPTTSKYINNWSTKSTSARLSHATPSSAGTSYVTSSAGPSQVTLSSVRSSHIARSPDRPWQSILTSVRLSRAARSHGSPSQSIRTSVRFWHAIRSPNSPSQSIRTSVRLSHATRSPDSPSQSIRTSVRLLHATRSPSSPSQETLSSLRSSYVRPSPAGPSHFTQFSAGPSQATPTFAGTYEGNQKKIQTQRTRSRSRVNQNTKELSGTVNCVTCNGHLGLHIYQCSNGHSSCDVCRLKRARCGNCKEQITDMRNITLESTLADITISSEERIKCSNAKDGCCLHFKRDELQNHLKECPFNIITCPVMEFSGDCGWKGTVKQLATHFNDAHPKHCEADVNKEMHMIVLELDYKVMHLVNIGFHKFLVHIRLDTSLNNIYMATQYLGTTFGASKWTYEWHVYNKKEPRRKFEYIDVCKSNATPVSEIVDNNDCAVININYAKTFLDSGKLTFKFYIKKQFDKKKYIDTTSN